MRYVALGSGSTTALAAISKRDGSVVDSIVVQGGWGFQAVTVDGAVGGISRDGSTIVLSHARPSSGALLHTSRFLVYGAKPFGLLGTIELAGDYTFDALSPRGHTLYLIQHSSASDLTRYRVRGYDLQRWRLLPRVIADKRQRGWTMTGYPLTRAASSDGRWVYTLYQQSSNYPFIHALDTVSRTAVCIGLPLRWGASSPLSNPKLRLEHGDGTLVVVPRHGAPAIAIDTRTFRISRVQPHRGGTSWLAFALAGAVGILLAAALTIWLRQRNTSAKRTVASPA
jgi:hypothetical protein